MQAHSCCLVMSPVVSMLAWFAAVGPVYMGVVGVFTVAQLCRQLGPSAALQADCPCRRCVGPYARTHCLLGQEGVWWESSVHRCTPVLEVVHFCPQLSMTTRHVVQSCMHPVWFLSKLVCVTIPAAHASGVVFTQ